MPEKKYQHPVVCFGETLWDILPHVKLPGGAPMNVAYNLNKLGKNPAIISRIGLDELGKELIQVFESRNINTEFFQVDYENDTGKVYANVKENNEMQYDIVQPAAWDFIQWEDSFTGLLENATYFVFGSLVTRNKQSRDTLFECLELANTKVLDVNLRAPFYNKKILEELLVKADILKLNLAELHLITGWFSNYETDADRIKLLQEKFGLQSIIITKGADGAILNMGDDFYRHPGFTVEIADTVGSGDAFLAGLISSFIDKASPEESLEFASRMGAFLASREGGCPDYSLNDIFQIPASHQIKTING